MARVLIVEDSAQIREAVTDFFVERSNGAFIVDAAPDGTEGISGVFAVAKAKFISIEERMP